MVKKSEKISKDKCLKSNVKQQWIVGITAVVLVAIFSIAMFNAEQRQLPVNNDPVIQAAFRPNSNINHGGFSQVALPAGCATCPSAPQCFPQTPVQQVAFRKPVGRAMMCPLCNFKILPSKGPGGMFNCPQCRGAFSMQPFSGAMSQVALPAGCATCPSAPQCFPQQPVQQVAFTKNKVAAPPITRDAIMPHSYRGVCGNCHQISGVNPNVGVR